ncbi:MAG: glycerophosphodiester phosphodiesterase [Gallionellaceae bacterium]|nr:glycerophosphodiester phosphodiesterase [Gallionellaceae bacterium]
MNSMSSTLIFAHRGANREAPENTRAAFDQALEYAIDGMETDVQLSRDEVAVLWHDRFLNKLGLADKHIDDFDYAQLHKLNFAEATLMSLQDFVQSYRSRCRLLLEIKNREWEPNSRHQLKVRLTLDEAGTIQDESIMASSFNLASLVYAHQYRPQFPLIYNLEEEQSWTEAQQVLADHSFLRGLCLPIENLDINMVQLLREHGKVLAVYTCNSDEEITKALDLAVDILISDVPQRALHMRDA